MGVPSKPPLFRQEVVEFQQQHRQWGRVVPMQPMPVRLMVWFISGAALAVIAFLFVAQYARKETVIGYLAPMAGSARIFAPQQGIVSAVHVEQGERVNVGQPLLSITTDQIAANGEDVNATILATLDRQKQSLTRQIAAEEKRGASDRERLTVQIQGLEAQIADIAAQILLQREQRRREEALLEQKLSLNAVGQQLTERRSQLSEARFNLEQLPIVTAEKIQQLRNELSVAEQRTAEVNGRRAYIIRAPISGRVSSLQASVGQLADPRRLQLQIIPGESALQAELFIPARAIGFVELGQRVRILYDAFPYQHYGTYRGRIVSVSQTILTSTDVAVPVTLTGPSYRAVVALERPDIDAYGKRIPLQPDMQLRADIILERRTLVDWILNPLLSARIQG
jgi:membrane fusion protein